MKHSIALGCFIAIGSAAPALHAEESTFKAYGFMDANYENDQYTKNNFLAGQGYLTPNQNFYVNHVNTYLDWKPNEKVRVLLELSLNRTAMQTQTAGNRLVPDSAAIYNSLDAQVGANTRAGTLAFLQTTPLAAYGNAVLTHMADSIAIDTLKKSTSQIVSQIRANSRVSSASRSTKDHGIEIPRIHADIAINDMFNLRVGKWITPSGIWNVDHGSPIILTVSQPNQTAFLPIFPVAQTGVQAFGRTNIGDHDLSYAGWISTGRGSNFTGSGDYAQAPKNIDDWAVGTHLQADLSLADIALRVGTTIHTGTERGEDLTTDIPVVGYDVTKAGTPAAVLTGGLETMSTYQVETSYQRDWIYGLDTKLKWKGLTLQGEWNHRKVLNLTVSDNPATDVNAWYALAAYEIPLGAQFNVTPYYMHERIEWNKTANNPALGLSDFPMNGWTIDQLGLNFGLWSTVHVKVEWAHNQIDPVNFSDRSSLFYNNLSADDLVVDRYAAQLSVAY